MRAEIITESSGRKDKQKTEKKNYKETSKQTNREKYTYTE